MKRRKTHYIHCEIELKRGDGMYPNDEKETTCMYDYATGKWTVYTCVPSHITRLSKLAEPFWKEERDGRLIAGKWLLDAKQVKFGNPRKVSEEQRQAAAERLRKSRAAAR